MTTRLIRAKPRVLQRFDNDDVNGQIRSFEFQDAITLDNTTVRRDNGNPNNNLNLNRHFGVEIIPGNNGAQERVRVWELDSMAQTLTYQVIEHFYMPTPDHPLMIDGQAVTSQPALLDSINQLLQENIPLHWMSPLDNVQRRISGVATGNDLLDSPLERV